MEDETFNNKLKHQQASKINWTSFKNISSLSLTPPPAKEQHLNYSLEKN